MYTKKVDNITIKFSLGGWSSIDRVVNSSKKCVPIVESLWGVKVPDKYSIYILDCFRDYLAMVISSCNIIQKAIIIPYLPLVYLKLKQSYSIVGGVAAYRKPIIGIKSEIQILMNESIIGKYIFTPLPNIEQSIESIICHELFHIAVNPLHLPQWLNEGLAMYAQDKINGKRSVRDETLEYIARFPYKNCILGYKSVSEKDASLIVYAYARSYWLVNYFEEKYPGLIKEILDHHLNNDKIEKIISHRTGMKINQFWKQIDQILFEYFTQKKVAELIPINLIPQQADSALVTQNSSILGSIEYQVKGENYIHSFAYVSGAAALIPLWGIPFGLISIIWGVISKKRGHRLVTILGALGILLSSIIFGNITPLSEIRAGSMNNNLIEKNTESSLSQLVLTIEFYKSLNGEYPSTLDELYTFSVEQGIVVNNNDPMLANGNYSPDKYFYNLTDDSSGYYLRSVGFDGKPFTSDDILPDIDLKNLGLQLDPESESTQ